MAFSKVLKTNSYFKRFQVKFRRRREGKTDYYQRKRLISQDKDRYNVRKYRLIVRLSNRYVICQIAYSTISGDIIVTQANSKELKRYGIKAGLSNYAAAYATGLLVARRHLAKIDLASKHVGCIDATLVGEDIDNLLEIEGNRAFKAVLDIGLSRSTTGARIFGAMKGALDGGINIPHDPKRFVGNNKKSKEYHPEVHRDHIYGIHISDYMKRLKETDGKAYERQFSQFIKEGIAAEDIEPMYKKAHELIRSDPQSLAKIHIKKPKIEKTHKEVKKCAKAKIQKRKYLVEQRKQEILTKLKSCA